MLTRGDLERIFIDLRALIDGTDLLDANRAHAVGIATTITQALEREESHADVDRPAPVGARHR